MLRTKLFPTVALGVVIIGFVLGIYAGWRLQNTQTFLRTARLTTGHVVDVKINEVFDSDQYYPLIQFVTTPGQVFQLAARAEAIAPAPWRIGDPVALYYDPANPYHAEVKSFTSQYLTATLSATVALLFIIGGLVGYLRLRNSKFNPGCSTPG